MIFITSFEVDVVAVVVIVVDVVDATATAFTCAY